MPFKNPLNKEQMSLYKNLQNALQNNQLTQEEYDEALEVEPYKEINELVYKAIYGSSKDLKDILFNIEEFENEIKLISTI